MSNQNPLIPQGSLLEQKAKGKPYLRVAYVIVALHLLFLGGLLIQGCKREEPDTKLGGTTTNESTMPALDSASLYSSNPPAASTNVPDLAHGAAATTNLSPQAPAGTPVPEPPPAGREYVVLKGDSFYSIGKKFGVSANSIARANPGIDSTRLKIGDKLQIPAAASSTGGTSGGTPDVAPSDLYVVKAGDTLAKIAKTHGATVAEIKSLNGLTTDRINAGQKLKLPPAKAAAPATAPATAAPPQAGTPTTAVPNPPTGVGVSNQ
jgi:LysM repeat protein